MSHIGSRAAGKLVQHSQALKDFISKEDIEQAENEKHRYNENKTKAFQKLPNSKKTISIEWALQQVKDQKREGACTAFALSAAVEAYVMAQLRTKIKIDAYQFWMTYRQFNIYRAIDAASGESSRLIARVMEDSPSGKFREGELVSINIQLENVKPLVIHELADSLLAGHPILFTSQFDDNTISKVTSKNIFIPAVVAGEKEIGHVQLLTGISRNLKGKDDLWFHLRNSWGYNWGQGGSAYLNSQHCRLNQCFFLALTKLSMSSWK
jgi:aminopeptidase C